ncbi:bacteriophage large tail fiber protein [Asticcacaulis biprosthecium C19]|uniref:Bacteriophage large tail fiber protein n=1 Tax=Asticcacaulis biprosthecium C19 TaxID=715226 RepID=F4QJC0_9CAUL|nr:hypothetical protein [Asticcacaulis biprosthecium]EGF93103.1 bacteriophage large tail fiber protein [Asticcacaulis biprosthecium C19]
MALQLIVTTAGRAAIAALGGTDAVVISEVGVTASHVVVSEATTVLTGEIKRIDTVAGVAIAADQIHLTVRDTTSDAYSLRSFALYLDDGTLFAAYGQPGVIMEKTAPIVMLMALDIALADIAAADITFGDLDFVLPPASTTVQGVVELATNAETVAGTDNTRATTPAGVAAAIDAIPYCTEDIFGVIELATVAEAVAGIDPNRAVTSVGLAAAIAAIPAASDTVAGKVELATDAEALAGTDTDRAVTPAAMTAAISAAVAAVVAGIEADPHRTQLGEGRTFHRSWPESDYYKYPKGHLLPLPAYQDLADALAGDPALATTIEQKAANPSMWYISPGSHVHMPDLRGQFTRIWHDDLVDGVTRPALGRRKANQNKLHTHASDPFAGTNGGAYGAEPFEGGTNPGGNQTGSSGGDESVPDHTAIWYLIRVL